MCRVQWLGSVIDYINNITSWCYCYCKLLNEKNTLQPPWRTWQLEMSRRRAIGNTCVQGYFVSKDTITSIASCDIKSVPFCCLDKPIDSEVVEPNEPGYWGARISEATNPIHYGASMATANWSHTALSLAAALIILAVIIWTLFTKFGLFQRIFHRKSSSLGIPW